MLGHDLMTVVAAAGHEVSGIDLPEIDITSHDSVKAAMGRVKPEVVVNAAGTSATSSADEFTYADPQAFAGVAITPAADVVPLTLAQLQPLLACTMGRRGK